MLALVGVSNGAIQFVAYEKMKKWGFDQKKRQAERIGKTYNQDLDKLVRTTSRLCKICTKFFQSNLAYSSMSISSKFMASAATYPYQVVRSRTQVSHLFWYMFLYKFNVNAITE